MLKILLLDSDKDNIKNFENYLNATYPEPEIEKIDSGSDNSEDIIEKIRNEDINLIVGDVRFFGSSQKIENINNAFPEMKLILYGTHDDAETLKSSTDFGVISYMYKPVKPAEFKKAMENAMKILKSHYSKQREEALLLNAYLEDIKFFEDKFLENVLFGNVKNDIEIIKSFKYFKLGFSDSYCVCVINIEDFEKKILTLDEMEKHMMIFKVLSIVNLNIPANAYKATVTNFNTISVIASGKTNLESVLDICQKIRKCVLEEMKLQVVTGIGRVYKKPCEIAVSYREAEAALRYRFYAEHNGIIPFEFVEPGNHITNRYPFDKEKRLVNAAVVGEYEYCRTLLNDIINALRSFEKIPDDLIPKIILSILMSISRYASEQNLIDYLEFTKYFPIIEGLKVKTLDEAYTFMDDALRKFCEYIVLLHGERDQRLIKEIKEYIDEKYNENLTIYEVALAFGMAHEYLNNVFATNENKNFEEFLITKQIIRAKELIRESDMNDEQIALAVGFDNIKTFRNLFKENEDMFPYEYRTLQGLGDIKNAEDDIN